MTDEQLSALLRLKRHEQPPAQYFDRLLQDVHRRQRAELLQRPLWKIAVERIQTLFSEHSMGNLSYAGALASVLVVGIAGIGLMTSSHENAGPTLASATPPSINSPAAPTDRVLTLASTYKPALPAPALSTEQPAYESLASSQPRYIIDARPVSYAPSPVNF